MTEYTQLDVGMKVQFTGFTGETEEDRPENAEALEKGEVYEIIAINPETDENEESYELEAPNPNFDDSKRASKKSNPRTVPVVVFSDEVGLPDDEDEGEQDEEEHDDEDEDEGEEEQEEEKKPARKAPAKKAAAKKSGTRKTTASKKTGGAKAGAKKATAKKSAKKEAPKEEEDEDLKGMVILEEGEEDESILELINEADDLCELAVELSEESIQAEYRLGGVLYHTRITKAFRKTEKGKYDVKGGWQQYVEGELSVGYRKAMYLIDVYAKWNKHDLDPEIVARIGWAKASAIAGVMTDENAEELVGEAEKSTVADLKDTIKESYTAKGASGKKVVKKVTFKFRLIEDKGKTVMELFEKAKKSLGIKKDEDAFEHIVTEWAAQNLEVSETKATRKSSRRTGRT